MVDDKKQIKSLLKIWGASPESKTAFMHWISKQLGNLTVNEFNVVCKTHIEHMSIKKISTEENLTTIAVKAFLDSAYEKLINNKS